MTGFYWANVVEPEFLAQTTDLGAYMGTPEAPAPLPDNATAILRSVSAQVLTATQGAFYDADPTTGLATEPETLNAMIRATCIQAAAWIALKIDPFAGGAYLPGGVKSTTKIGSASVTRDQADSAAAVAARAAAIAGLVPDATRVLQHHNLIGNGPWTFG